MSILLLQVNRTTLRTKIALPETVRQDKGNYKLVAENCYGTAQQVIRVEILGKNQNLLHQLFIDLFSVNNEHAYNWLN